MKPPQFFFLIILLFSIEASGQKEFVQVGKASYYADKFNGRKTASGEIYDHSKKTAAHLTLAFGTKVRVTNLANKKSVVVKINDRGPFVKGRIIDLSKSAAKQLNFLDKGLTEVKVEILNQEGSSSDKTKQQKKKKK